MKNTSTFVIAFILLITMVSCNCYKVIDAGYDETTNFSKYKSFAWVPTTDTTNTRYDNSEFRNSLIKSFTNQLIKQKYVGVSDAPDFYIDLTISYCNQTRDEEVPVPQIRPYSNTQPGRGNTVVAPRDIRTTATANNSSSSTTTFNFTTSAPTNYTPANYVTQTVSYIEDYVSIDIIDSKTNEIILSITSEADINSGDEIPDSSNSIAKHLMQKVLQLKKEASNSSLPTN